MSKRSWSAWVDRIIDYRSTTAGGFVENFDGLRALAALMVFALHLRTVPHVVLGPAGVFLFFTLSGFLLYSGFLSIKDRPDTRTIVAYLTRRVFRVLPLYAVCVVSIAFLFSNWTTEFAWAWTKVHLMFVKGDQHLWTMKTEVVFYLYLPVLILILYPIRSHRWRFVALSFAGVAAWYLFEVRQIVQLRGATAFFAPFLFGMAAVHLRHRVSPPVARALVIPSLAAILIVSSDFSFGKPIREYFGLHHLSQLWEFGYLVYLPCAALVLGVSKERSWLWGNRFLRLIGVSGFGFYLWHLPIIQMVAWWGLPTPLYELTCFVLTLALSLVTYLTVEKPGIFVGRALARWIRQDVRKFFLFRPAWLCLILVASFFGYQHLFFAGRNIDISVELWPSQPTVAKVYVDSGDGFSERSALHTPVREKTWQVLTFNIRDVS
ncbi:MAG: acyltransferase, partial [Gammaproteobacteria bacterium]|nr:acyltransferase [Gammaproteobacteria bacterium]